MTSEAPGHGWLIHKAGRGWYRPQAKGYTMNQDEAGRYSHKDALAYSHPNGLDGPRDGLTIKHESELPPSPAALHQQALDTAREEGRRAGLEEAAKWVKAGPDLPDRSHLRQSDFNKLSEEIRALIDKPDKPADPVAEAARVLLGADYESPILEALDPFNNDIETHKDVLSALRVLAQKEEDQ